MFDIFDMLRFCMIMSFVRFEWQPKTLEPEWDCAIIKDIRHSET